MSHIHINLLDNRTIAGTWAVDAGSGAKKKRELSDLNHKIFGAEISLELTIDTHVQKDITKPDGEACNDDGTLKDASLMNWVNSPLDETPPPFPACGSSVGLGGGVPNLEWRKQRVSTCWSSMLQAETYHPLGIEQFR